MALDLKSVARNQFASKANRAVQGGLRKVAGNILGSALGSTSPLNSPSIGFGGAGPFGTSMYNFPNDVATDPHQGHYINFSIYETTPAKITAAEAISKAGSMAKFSGELFGGMGVPDSPGSGGLSARAGTGGDAAIVGLDQTKLGAFTKLASTDKAGLNKTNSIRLQRSSTKRVGSVISLYMPPNISVSYNANYTDEPIGAVADTALGVIDAFMQTGAFDPKEITRDVLMGAEHAARAAILGTLNAVAPGARALYALENGQVITPRLELMFANMGRRDFSYSFVFIPRDQSEATSVEQIIKTFKANMAADYKEDMGAIAGMRTMSIPNIFKIEYMYHNAPNTHLNTIGFCSLRNVEVSYGSDRFVSYEGGYPQTTKLNLSFSELDIITKTAIEDLGR